MARFSLQNERRNDLLTEIDNAANVIKNDLRGAKEIGICTSSSVKSIYKKDDAGNASKLGVLKGKLVWLRINLSTCSGTEVEKELTTTQLVNVKTLQVSYSIDSLNSNDTNLNTLLYINAEIYDNAPRDKVFDPEKNPYSYVFAISTRKINVI